MTSAQAQLFIEEVQARTRVLPALYSGNTLKEAVTEGFYPGILLKCRLWLAQYGPKAVLPKGWSEYWLWQHADDGVVPGISGDVDLDRFDGTEEELRASWTPLDLPEIPVALNFAAAAEFEALIRTMQPMTPAQRQASEQLRDALSKMRTQSQS